MCGIAGIVCDLESNVNLDVLQKMTHAIKHRGPEGDGFWIDKNEKVGLGHRRLSIIDLSQAGAQPMHYLDRYTITYNGELYNYIELRQELKRHRFTFSSDCDTEVILAAYAFYGKDCLQHFDGMFAFAIWDRKEQTLFCARDRFGEKPFYYHEGDEAFYFASEMKALWAAGIPKEMNDTMLLNYLTLGYTSDPTIPFKTFYKDIIVLPPAHYLELTLLPNDDMMGFEFDTFCYWDLNKEVQVSINENDAIEKFSHLFETSVKRRLRSDVAIGTSLSGGLDSSSIVASANRLLKSNINYRQTSFSAVFPGFDKDESQHIRTVADRFRLKSYTISPTATDLANDFERLQFHQEEPFQSSSIYAQFRVYELAKHQGVTVLLDGQGADEILAGYHKYYHWYWQQLIRKFQIKHQAKEKKAALAMGLKIDWTFKNYLAAFSPASAAEALSKRAFNQQKKNGAINKAFFDAFKDESSLDKPVVTSLNDILYYNSMQHGLQELLRYADRNSMAHSREVRLPFLSHQLVEFVFSLPANFKIRDGFTKWILRTSMDSQLPHSITWRKDKIGFEPPQYSWLQNKQLQDKIHESKKHLVNLGVLDHRVMQQNVTANHAHDGNNFDWRYLSAAHCL